MDNGKKMGRPKMENPKTKQIPVRFTDSDYEKMKRLADQNHTTVTQLIRKSVDYYIETFS